MRLTSLCAVVAGLASSVLAAPSTPSVSYLSDFLNPSLSKIRYKDTYSTGTIRKYTLDVTHQTFSPDGMDARNVTIANGILPGPVIEANQGDTLQITIKNDLDDYGTAIHFHGISFYGTPYYDGATGVSQCPIPIGKTLTMSFILDHAGTSWWHAHHAGQYMDGLWGVVKIHPRQEAYQYDGDYTITLNDWFPDTGPNMIAHFLSPASAGEEPVPQSGLLNGRNNYSCAYKQPTQCTQQGTLPTYPMVPGKKYRFRLINTSAYTNWQLSIDQHDMQIIEADFTDLQALTVQTLSINIGQRYSFIVTANQKPGNYWIRAIMDENCYPGTDLTQYPLRNDLRAALTYTGTNATALPNSTAQNPASLACVDLNINDMHPLVNDNLTAAPVQNFLFNITIVRKAGRVTYGLMDGSAYVNTPDTPTLETLVANPNATLDSTQNAYTITQPGWVQVTLQNFDTSSDHPFHLHGHQFNILAWSPNSTYAAGAPLNTVNPLRRDTSTIPAGGYTVIRFYADNPGVWLLHCHIEFHFASGFAVQFVELPAFYKKLTIPNDITKQCAAQSN